jgi:hypothetical protein
MQDLNLNSHIEDIARELYGAYDRRANGVTFDGKPLPTWHELDANRQQCWIAAAERASEIFASE